MFKNISLFYNKEKAKSVVAVNIIKKIATEKEIEVVINEITPNTQLVFSIGGDGMVLKTARAVAESAELQSTDESIPIAGIHLGTLGFLGIEVEKIKEYAESLIMEKFSYEFRVMLEAECGTKTFTALNDIVIKNGGTARVINLELYIAGKKVYEIKGDGVIISTPTGSTAYSLAAGGPVVIPDEELLVITPINPHTLTTRSLVTSSKEIKVRCLNKKDEVILTADGQVMEKLTPPVTARIKMSKYKAKLITGSDDFFTILGKKLKWSHSSEKGVILTI